MRRFIFHWAPVPRRLPPAESSFEVIMGLLANAPLQVPPLSSLSLPVSQHSQRDEKGWESFQSPHMRPIFPSLHRLCLLLYLHTSPTLSAIYLLLCRFSLSFQVLFFALLKVSQYEKNNSTLSNTNICL